MIHTFENLNISSSVLKSKWCANLLSMKMMTRQKQRMILYESSWQT